MNKCKPLFLSLLIFPLISPVLAPGARGIPTKAENVTTLELGANPALLVADPNIEWRRPEPKSTATPRYDTLDKWLDGLIEKESSNRSWLKILDTNGKYSFGCLQFQEATFISYSRRYFGHTNLDRLNGDCEYQKVLARRMIEDDRENWRHWFHSVWTRGLGLPPT